MKATCPLCGARRARRACPGVRSDICAVCCGTKRLTEIACPPDCPYLSSARAHPPAVVQRQQERDFEFLLPRIRDLSEAQYQLMLFFEALIVRETASAMPPFIDADVVEACASTAATLETARKGIIYEHHAASLPARQLAGELKRAYADLTAKAGAQAARLERDAAVALRHVERTARDAAAAFPDAADARSAWMAFVRRLMSTPPTDASRDEQPAAGAPEKPETPRIIIP
jgi:hypothetical protein